MQGTTPAYLFIGLIAGLVSALMFAAAQTGSFLFLFFFFIVPVPLYLAGLGWGAISALVGGVAGSGAIAIMASFQAGLFYALAVAAAPVLISHFALKSRPALNEDGTEGPDREWYPEGRLVLISAAFIAGAIAFAVFGSGITPATLIKAGEEIAENFGKLPAGTAADPVAERMVQFKDSMKRLAPHMLTISAIGWTVFVVLGWAVAAKLLSAAGRSVREWAPFHKLDFPKTASIGLAVATLASFMTGQFGLIGEAALAAALTAFFILGLACLHGLVARASARTPLLFGAYTLLVIFPFAIPAVLVLGLGEHLAGLRARFAGIHPTPS